MSKGRQRAVHRFAGADTKDAPAPATEASARRQTRLVYTAVLSLGLLGAAAAGAAAPSSIPACSALSGADARCDVRIRTDSAGLPSVHPTPVAGLTPSALREAYGLVGAGGSVTIAVVDAYDNPRIEHDLREYDRQFGLPICTRPGGCFQKIDQTGGRDFPPADQSWGVEIALDVEVSQALCPQCRILLVEADSAQIADLGAALDEAVALGADVVLTAFGRPEYPQEVADDEAHFDHPGTVVVASSGDAGYGTQFPAASAHVVSVGGTTLLTNPDGSWASETVWDGSGSGCSEYIPKPSWQADGGCTMRTIADVSADADPSSGATIFDSFGLHGKSGWFEVGGTSLSAALVAGAYAVASDTASAPYAASFTYAHAAALHDVTAGSTGACAPSYLCTAQPGYDGPTGLGTPNGPGGF